MGTLATITMADPLAAAASFGVELEGFTTESISVGGYREPRDLVQADDGAVAKRIGSNHPIGGRRCWGAEHDGSVGEDGVTGEGQPLELTSPALRGAAGLAELHGFLADRKRNGFNVNRSAGVHVHVGVRDLCQEAGLDGRQTLLVAALVVRYVRRFSLALYGAGGYRYRARMTYSHSLKSGAKNVVDACEDLAFRASSQGEVEAAGRWASDTWANHCSRYYAVNLIPLRGIGTIEFRAFAATAEPDVAVGYVAAALAIVSKAVRRVKRVTAADIDSWVASIGERNRWSRTGMLTGESCAASLDSLTAWAGASFVTVDGLSWADTLRKRAAWATNNPDTPYEETEGDGWSPECDTCGDNPSDCDCWQCEGCDDRLTNCSFRCSCCDNCEGCCSCYHCENCDETTEHRGDCACDWCPECGEITPEDACNRWVTTCDCGDGEEEEGTATNEQA